ncbi:hypothetical protein OROGR_031999 [Orobanche gracilis]
MALQDIENRCADLVLAHDEVLIDFSSGEVAGTSDTLHNVGGDMVDGGAIFD